MKKIIVLFCLCMGIAQAEFFEANATIPEYHQIIVSKTKNIDLNGDIKKELVFFGTKEEASTAIVNGTLNGAVQGLNASLDFLAQGAKAGAQGAGVGAAVGVVAGVGVYTYNKLNDDKKFILITDIINSKNEKTRIISLFVADTFENKEIIKKYLIEKENRL